MVLRREVRDDVQGELPLERALQSNFPNPFNTATTIRFNVVEAGHVTLRVYDTMGRLVNTLADQYFEAGEYERTWDARLINGANAPSGVYFYTLESSGSQQRVTRSMLLVR